MEMIMSMQTTIGGEAAAPAAGTVATAASGLARRAGQAVATILLPCAIWKADADLMALSDRTLKDIGLSRGEIPSAVREVLAASRYVAHMAWPAQN
jgi:hypothetical protein